MRWLAIRQISEWLPKGAFEQTEKTGFTKKHIVNEDNEMKIKKKWRRTRQQTNTNISAAMAGNFRVKQFSANDQNWHFKLIEDRSNQSKLIKISLKTI